MHQQSSTSKAACTLMLLTAAIVSKVQFAAESFHIAAHQLPANF
jgi:hypothetical protein